MPSVGLKYVVSFSSQDEKHPVTNLIRGDGYKKWLCHPQEKSGSVEAVFQLEEFCCISYLDIGSIWCATIEIQVGRSDWPAGRDFETLVYTVSLMTPTDCNLGKNCIKTQMFSSDLFCPLVAKQQWDRVRVICKQPYRKLTQFGLSFIRVKTAGSTSCKQMTSDVTAEKTSSVKSIQKHFFGKLSNGLPSPKENLKSKLLKIAGTAENGAEHDGSLSRTAKLVLAASESKPNTRSPATDNRNMFSNHIEQKYGPKFEDEAKEFFSNLTIDESELDNIMIADVRHKFERQKRRKLTKEEKKIFRDMAENFISEKFGLNENENQQNMKPFHSASTETPPTARQIPSHKAENSKSVVTDTPEITNSHVRNTKNTEVKSKPPVKRKLDETKPVTPVAKIKKVDSIIQKIKSPESIKPFSERTNLEPAKNKVNLPQISRTEVTPSAGVFKYKGIRGGEDLLSQSESPLAVDAIGDRDTVSSEKPENVLRSPGNGGNVPNFSDSSLDDSWLPDIINNSFETDVVCSNENVKSKRGRGKKERRRAGRGKGRGRGQDRALDSIIDGLNNLADVLDQTADIISPTGSTRGRGRGRGRGKVPGRGRGRKKNELQGTSTPTVVISPAKSPPRAPRGFTSCTGCNDWFGDSLIAAHHLRCSAYKAKQSSPEPVCSTPARITSQFPETPSPRQRGRGRGRGSGRGKKTKRQSGYTECEGCHDLIGTIMIARHQDRCTLFQLRLRYPDEYPDTPPTPARYTYWPTDVDLASDSGSVPKGRGRGRGNGAGGQSRKKASSTASLEIRPSGFAKCDGCNQYFGENLLSAHQQRCPGMKNKQKQTNSEIDGPWLSARPSDTVSTSPSTKSSCRTVASKSISRAKYSPGNGYESNSTRDEQEDDIDRAMGGSSSHGENNTRNEMRSPPWLVAAEKRLQEQRHQCKLSASTVETSASVSSARSYNNTDVGNGANNKMTAERKAFLDAQAKQLEKYGSVSDSLADNCSSYNANTSANTSSYTSTSFNTNASAGSVSFAGTSYHTRGGFDDNDHSVDLTADSDNDNDGLDDPNDDLDGFIVNDDVDDYADYNPDISSQVYDDGDTSSDDDDQPDRGLIERNILVECPLCGEYFPDVIIEMHASTCYL